MEKGSEQPKKHTLMQTARQKAVISGVLRVNSFDEQLISLATDCGEMTVEGEGLHVGVLDIERGAVELEGLIHAVYYSEAAPQRRRRGIFR